MNWLMYFIATYQPLENQENYFFCLVNPENIDITKKKDYLPLRWVVGARYPSEKCEMCEFLLTTKITNTGCEWNINLTLKNIC